ncbi:MAG: HypC/HybG/HupF family hydrogenase formation chaperone [Candidatus Binataceae bacterium]
MCLGIPGKILAFAAEHPDLAEVEVAGQARKINIGILEQRPKPGDWVLIQAGFALEIIDERTARMQLELLRAYTGVIDGGEEPDPE